MGPKERPASVVREVKRKIRPKFSTDEKTSGGYGANGVIGVAQMEPQPIEKMVRRGRIELPTHGFSVRCSTS